MYNRSSVRDDYDEPGYGMIDTLFSLAEAYLFMALAELLVRAGCALPGARSGIPRVQCASRAQHRAPPGLGCRM